MVDLIKRKEKIFYFIVLFERGGLGLIAQFD
jgi:hypothetical protein